MYIADKSFRGWDAGSDVVKIHFKTRFPHLALMDS